MKNHLAALLALVLALSLTLTAAMAQTFTTEGVTVTLPDDMEQDELT